MVNNIYKVLDFNSDWLKVKCKPIHEITEEVFDVSEKMARTMYNEKGIGLSANQVGIDMRLVVMDLSKSKNSLEVYINPEILDKSKKLANSKEGCLSVPGYQDTVKRYKTVTVEYTDLFGNKQVEEMSGLQAYCIQHEIDHLNGKIFVDKLSPNKQKFAKFKSNLFISATKGLP